VEKLHCSLWAFHCLALAYCLSVYGFRLTQPLQLIFFYAFYDAYQFCRPNLCKSYSVWWHFNCVRTVIRTVGVCWFWYSSRESLNFCHIFVTLLRGHFWLYKRSPEVSNRHIVSLKAINIQNFHFFIFKQIR